MMANLFVYGILLADASERATLQGYRLDFGSHATVVEEEGGITYGGVVRDVDPMRLGRYDSIEGFRPNDPEGSYYERRRVAITTDAGPEYAWVYVMTQENLEAGQEYGMTPYAIAWRMHQQYDRLHSPIYAHDELDHVVERWHAEQEARRA